VPSETTPTAPGKKRRLREYLEARRPASIGEAEWNDLLRELGPVSESYLRKLVRATGLPFEPPWSGVRQDSFEELERSLLAMGEAYAEGLREGRRDRARDCRRQVISAKDHARWAARNRRTGAAKRAQKEEMVEWMLVWLGDPEVFPEWVRVRKRVLEPPGS
jgi:hypothetical protein